MVIAVLGAGMVGRTIALDLASSFAVTAFDINPQSLQILKQRNPGIKVEQKDLLQFDQYKHWLPPFEIVVTAVPGFMGFDVLKAVIDCGKNVADISFFPENALDLDHLAKEKNITAITDIGVAPGLSNLILGYYDQQMTIKNFECYVGGLPKIRQKPFEYKAPFSPVDIIEEYTRPARLKENGEIITKPALSDRELLNFTELGMLEAFDTDGLRSLLFTMPHIPNMKEKTLRYPGHIELIIALKQAGFFEKEKIDIQGKQISPLEFSSKILFRDWKLGDLEEELTVMRIIIEGKKNALPKRIEYNLLDRYDKQSKTHSMSRTTGYTCTAAVNLLANGIFNKKGVFPPELVGTNEECFNFIVNYLKERNVEGQLLA